MGASGQGRARWELQDKAVIGKFWRISTSSLPIPRFVGNGLGMGRLYMYLHTDYHFVTTLAYIAWASAKIEGWQLHRGGA